MSNPLAFFFGILWGFFHFHFYRAVNYPNVILTEKLVAFGLLVALMDLFLLMTACAAAFVLWNGGPIQVPTRVQQLRRRTVF